MALTDQVKGYWKLNAAGLLVDATGLNPALTNNNGVTSVAGKVGEAAQFVAASSQYLSTPSSANLQTGDIDFTIAAWVYLDTAIPLGGIVSKWTAAGFEFDLRQGGLGFEFAAAGGAITIDEPAATLLGVWYFVVAWHDSVNDTVNIQVNNGAITSAAWAAGITVGTAPFAIGEGNGVVWNGRIDEALFAKRVYTVAERTQLWNNGNGITYPFATLTSQTGPGGPVEGMLLSSYERTATTTVEGFRNA